MVTAPEDLKTQVTHSNWFRALSKYEQPALRRAIWQLCNTFIPYAALWIVMVMMLHRHVAYWKLTPLIVVAAGLLVRIFIFFHDCGHGSFFASRRANRILGYCCGILTFTPFDAWRLSHARHHAAVGDLDRRGGGDVKTLTVEEYRAAPARSRASYWIYRNPLVLFVLGPPILFFILQRFPRKGAASQERNSVLFTDLAILVVVAVASWTIGLGTYLWIQIPVMSLAGSMGIWMFYVQHQYEDVYWAHHTTWDPIRAALKGSSYYKLPRVLQWFSGNIGLHHIHHLRPRIPNYNLQEFLEDVPALQLVPPLNIQESLKSLFLNLWDEKAHKMVSFRSIKTHPPQTGKS